MAVTAGQLPAAGPAPGGTGGSRWSVRQKPPWQASRYAHARAAASARAAMTLSTMGTAWHTRFPRPESSPVLNVAGLE